MSKSANPVEETRIRKDTTINLRLPVQTRDLIDAAASALGKSRTEFVLDSARTQAIDVLLDQRFFHLDASEMEHFLEILDRPPEPNEKLRDLLKRKAPWDQ